MLEVANLLLRNPGFGCLDIILLLSCLSDPRGIHLGMIPYTFQFI
jgi:hypothetical protein